MNRDTRIRQRHLREENRKYGPEMKEVPPVEWISKYGGSVIPARVFRSSRFLAQIFHEKDGAIRISVNRTEIDKHGNWLQGISWDDLQSVKAECGFPNCWAVEIFPAQEHLVNVANIRHLFVLPTAPEFAWVRERAEVEGA